MVNKRIPNKVVFPFGYVIKVEQVSPQHKDLYTESGYMDGIWDPSRQLISINKSLPAKRRRRILYHELEHALNDAAHYFIDEKIIGD